MSQILDEDESLCMVQSDMTSAFYLFGLPAQGRNFLAFNLTVTGNEIGLDASVKYALACCVLPTVWVGPALPA